MCARRRTTNSVHSDGSIIDSKNPPHTDDDPAAREAQVVLQRGKKIKKKGKRFKSVREDQASWMDVMWKESCARLRDGGIVGSSEMSYTAACLIISYSSSTKWHTPTILKARQGNQCCLGECGPAEVDAYCSENDTNIHMRSVSLDHQRRSRSASTFHAIFIARDLNYLILADSSR